MSALVEYAEGFDYGVQWAEQDVRDSIPAAAELRMLEDETRTESRKMRAFYLGALRGYRETIRTLRDGRWGT